jgi:NADH-quinone oxidoreductase subunit N
LNEALHLLPELMIALTLALVVVSEITYHGEQLRLVSASAWVGLAAALLQTVNSYRFGPAQVFSGALSVDGLSLFFKLLLIVAAALSIFAASRSREIAVPHKTEYVSLILASTLAMCVLSAANDLLVIFLCLQFLNLMNVFLAGYGKRSILSTEAAVKHLVLAAVAGALLMYVMALLFMASHSLNLLEIHKALVEHPLERGPWVVLLVTLFAALSFQLGAFPMSLWVPDVIEGSPTPSAAFIAFGTRAAGFAVALRFFVGVFAQAGDAPGQWKVLGDLEWTSVLALASGLTMLIGALLAVRQASAKRMAGYLIVSQSGFFLMGLLVLDQVGVSALLYNWVIELISLLGVFYVIAFIRDETGSDRLDALQGMLKRSVPECVCLVLFFFCLVGAPPTPGFVGKFALIGAAVRHHWTGLAALSVISVCICIAAVARLCFHLVGDFRAPAGPAIAVDSGRRIFLMSLIVPMVLATVGAEWIFNWAGRSLGFILW